MMPATVMRERELGYCLVTTETGGYWHLQRDQYARVRTAWDKGALRVHVVEFNGSVGAISLQHVDSVLDISPQAVINALAEQRANDTDDSLNTNG